jgi:CBS-domain-containing membrane protein
MALAKEWPLRKAILAGIGGALTIGLLGAASARGYAPVLIAPFGATCVLVFGAPASPFARPRNVIGGHLLAAVVGLLACSMLGHDWLGAAVGVGLAIALMILTETVHPPAGANPIVIALAHAGWSFLAAPVFAGAVVVVAIGAVYHRWAMRMNDQAP